MSIAYKTLVVSPILLTQILLIVLKLNGNVHWSYATILFPLWVIFGICFLWAVLSYINYRYKIAPERINATYISNTLSISPQIVRQQHQSNLVEWRWYEDITV